MLVVDLIKSF